MALIERINQMKAQGMSDEQIKRTLLEERFTPVQIQEGLSQAQIKSIIAPEQSGEPGQQPISGQEPMQPSVMQTSGQPEGTISYQGQQDTYQEQEGEPQWQQAAYPEQTAQENYPEEAYAEQGYAYPEHAVYSGSQGGYAQGEYYPPETYYQQALDAETVRDIAGQAIETELGKTKEKIEEILKLKTELQSQVENMDSRLKKVEDIIEGLQSAILKKIGNYGEVIDDISKELQATQESFAKLADPIIDEKRRGMLESAPESQTKIRTAQAKSKSAKSSGSKGSSSSSSLRSKSAPSFEDYFR